MKEASATEASGLVGDQDGTELAVGATPGASTQAGGRPLRSPSSDAAMRWADQLRKVTAKAPLQSLFVAFLLGVWAPALGWVLSTPVSPIESNVLWTSASASSGEAPGGGS